MITKNDLNTDIEVVLVSVPQGDLIIHINPARDILNYTVLSGTHLFETVDLQAALAYINSITENK